MRCFCANQIQNPGQNLILDGIKMGCVPTTRPSESKKENKAGRVRGAVTGPSSSSDSCLPTLIRAADGNTGQRWRYRGRLEIQI